MKIGMIGLGAMGLPIAQRLVDAGWAVAAFVRRAEVAATARGLGIEVVSSPSELAAASDLMIICVYSDEQVTEVVFGKDGIASGLRAGSILINHTTGRPATAERLAHLAGEHDAAFLDCALSGGPHDIERGQLTLLVGGDT
jgi:3-hydroxyisobutyrate dehydrogenase-like beta-hydroxyacid dehydrogenase